ncbi:MAG: ATP-binding protein [Candidatus Omnitrophica bacterium]|nr:ATP-binding protein [Candidatus Omnitrophota bacterium]
MKKIFNTTGPCFPNEHYMLPTQERCQGINELIDQKQYFVIHAARQSGKTTLLLELAQQLNAAADYYVLYCSLETLQEIPDVKEGIPAILRVVKTQLKFHPSLRRYPFADRIDYADFNVALREALTYLVELLDKPLVILFDEVDCLKNGTLISFLRQLRDGYVNRGYIPFVHSIALVGMRNIRDYKGKIREERETLGSSSPFNIVKASKTLRNFTIEEIARLFTQHTQETGQAFSAKIIQEIYAKTQGQPWLVNAIACEIIEQILEFDVSRKILLIHVEQAVQTLILQRPTHLDSLMERLTEKRVQKIVEPLILGETKGYSQLDDDYQYVLDLGLLHHVEKKLQPANPIYGEIMIRTLCSQSQMEMEKRDYPPPASNYLINGKLDMKKLLSDFQQFWRENSEIWTKRYQYQEAAPHLVLQAFLQKIINAGGQVIREVAEGTGRLDLCVYYQEYKYPVELKIRRGEKTYTEGLNQLADYMDKLSCKEGWLIVFDRRKKVKWEQKISWRTQSVDGRMIHIVGC